MCAFPKNLDKMATKNEIRKLMKIRLNNLSMNEIKKQSEICQLKVINSLIFYESKSICCYLSMLKELQTNFLLLSSFQNNKQVFIPKVIGLNSNDMKIYEMKAYNEIDSFISSKWGILEPSDEVIFSNDYANYLDIVFIPGVAFDRECRRLGHGKGYYGKEYFFLESYSFLFYFLLSWLLSFDQ